MRVFIIILIVVALIAIWLRSLFDKKIPKFQIYAMASKHVSINTVSILFLTDLHSNSFGSIGESIIKSIKKAKPDAILIGGDMMVTKPGKKMDFTRLDEFLSMLYGIAPIYYAEGNHELRMRNEPERYEGWWEQFNELLAAYDVKYLLDETVDIGENVYVSGLEIEPELYRKFFPKKMPKGYMQKHLKDMPPEDSVHVVMAHTPKYMKNYWGDGADLVLSGHYHGGVIGLPGFRSLISPDFRLFPKYSRGIYTDGKGHGGIVSAGLGTHTINFRLFNQTQFVMVDILPVIDPKTQDYDGPLMETVEKDGNFSYLRKDGSIKVVK